MAEKRYHFIEKLSYEMFRLPNGKVRYIDEKRYGGNGMLAWDKAQGRCEVCGTYENLCLHHKNGYSNKLEDLIVLCRKCHRNLEIKEKNDGRKKNV